MENEVIQLIINKLDLMHKNAQIELNYNTPFELLIAVILSAQCTDKRVNLVTADLFKTLKKPEDFAKLDVDTLGGLIKSCGFYRNKAKSIIETSKALIEKFNGVIPENIDDLTSLQGVGRKTANVILSNAFNIPAIAVDTHVFRVSKRIGLSDGKDVLDVENDLMNIIPRNQWSHIHHLLVHHGRYICKSLKPQCDICLLKEQCKYYRDLNK